MLNMLLLVKYWGGYFIGFQMVHNKVSIKRVLLFVLVVLIIWIIYLSHTDKSEGLGEVPFSLQIPQ